MELKDWIGPAALTAAVLVGGWVYSINQRIVATVPTNAVLAFDSECPTIGWERFSRLDGRFLVGASSSYLPGTPGGNPQVRIKTSNLPSFELLGQVPENHISLFDLAYQPGTGATAQQKGLATQDKPRFPAQQPAAIPQTIPVPSSEVVVKSSPDMVAEPIDIRPPYLALVFCRKM